MDKYNWDLTKLIKNEDDFKKKYAEADKLLDGVHHLLLNFKDNFKDAILKLIEAQRKVMNIYVFAHMNADADTRDTEGQRLHLKALNLGSKLDEVGAPLKPALLSLSREELDKLIKDNDMEDYRLFIEKIYRFKDHVLTEKEESILSAYGFLENAPFDAYNLLANADITFEDLESTDTKLNGATFISLLRNKDEKVRREAFQKYYKSYKGLENVISSLYLNNVKAMTTEAKLRGYNSALEMELYGDKVDASVYKNLIAAVHENLPALYKYYEIKKNFLGLKEQHMYDVYLNLTKEEPKKIPYEDAVEMVLESLKPMGEEYTEIAREGLMSRWVDVYPKEGKRDGAYSFGTYDSPPYILMNYNEDLQSVFTLAHELGHSMHSYFSRTNNKYIYSDYTIFVAEVASTTNELLLLNYLMDKAATPEEEIYLIDHYIDSFKSTVFRQTMFAEFEKITHERVEKGDALTSADFKDIYYNLNKLYFGGSVISDEEIAYEWSRIPHFYTDFYVYKYATGFSSAVTLSKNILSGDKKKLEAYLNFLKDGSNHYPLQQLKSAGVDLTTKEGVGTAMREFNILVKRLDKIIG